MQSLKKFYFGKQKAKVNTYIGGIGGTINTPALLASKLGISESRIKLFKVTGVDVECAIIGGNYNIPRDCWANNLQITYYLDNDGLVLGIDNYGFRECVNLANVNFPKCTSISIGPGYFAFYRCVSLTSVSFPEVVHVGTQSFEGCSLLTSINLPKATKIGFFAFSTLPAITLINIPKCLYLGTNLLVNSPGNDNVFLNIKTGCTINTNIALKTNNAGAPDGDLTYAKNTRSAIVNFYNNDGSYDSTL